MSVLTLDNYDELMQLLENHAFPMFYDSIAERIPLIYEGFQAIGLSGKELERAATHALAEEAFRHAVYLCLFVVCSDASPESLDEPLDREKLKEKLKLIQGGKPLPTKD